MKKTDLLDLDLIKFCFALEEKFEFFVYMQKDKNFWAACLKLLFRNFASPLYFELCDCFWR